MLRNHIENWKRIIKHGEQQLVLQTKIISFVSTLFHTRFIKLPWKCLAENSVSKTLKLDFSIMN